MDLYERVRTNGVFSGEFPCFLVSSGDGLGVSDCPRPEVSRQRVRSGFLPNRSLISRPTASGACYSCDSLEVDL